jgi:hypothetical protein
LKTQFDRLMRDKCTLTARDRQMIDLSKSITFHHA